MALRTKIREQLYQLHLYRGGRVPVEGLRGLLQAMENVQGHNVSIPDPKIAFFSAQTSTPSAAIVTGTGRVYGIWALSGTKSAAGTTSTLDAIIQVTDNSVVIGSFKVKSNQASEVYFFDSSDGIGENFGTNLKVAAVAAADGTSNPAAADRPDIVVIYGDDLVNTTDANLINVNFG
jgi:hypothetical protein